MMSVLRGNVELQIVLRGICNPPCCPVFSLDNYNRQIANLTEQTDDVNVGFQIRRNDERDCKSDGTMPRY